MHWHAFVVERAGANRWRVYAKGWERYGSTKALQRKYRELIEVRIRLTTLVRQGRWLIDPSMNWWVVKSRLCRLTGPTVEWMTEPTGRVKDWARCPSRSR
jgi:hypothetical protein